MTESPIWVGRVEEGLELPHRQNRGGSGLPSGVRLGPHTPLRAGRHAEKDEQRLRPVFHLPGQVRLWDFLAEQPGQLSTALLTHCDLSNPSKAEDRQRCDQKHSGGRGHAEGLRDPSARRQQSAGWREGGGGAPQPPQGASSWLEKWIYHLSRGDGGDSVLFELLY